MYVQLFNPLTPDIVSQKMAANLTNQVRSIAEVTHAVANGDLSKKVVVDVRGEMLDLKNTVNSMVTRLHVVANEVTRVSLEVSTEGIHGGRAVVPSVEGMWKVLTDNVNMMVRRLMYLIRGLDRGTVYRLGSRHRTRLR
jgi:osomolarity two-component system sensor histidine kinase NIK1